MLFLRQQSSYYIDTLAKSRPDARCFLRGDKTHPDLAGKALFFQTKEGVLLQVEVIGLPAKPGRCDGGVFGFHIHAGDKCAGTPADPFAGAMGHYNPYACKHPEHAGDLPPLFEAKGRVFMVFLTDRFTVRDVIGKTMIIHARPDDFTTQPSGNAGARIACGVIRR